MNSAILILNGYINHHFIKNDLKKYQNLPIYVTDGAINSLININFDIKAVIGDFDSCKVSFNFKKIILADQNYTDFEKSLMFLMKKKIKNVLVYGASGKELDHTINNFAILKKFYKKLNISFIDEYSYMFIASKHTIINNVLGKMISVIPIFYATCVNYEGLAFNLNNENLSFSKRSGIRNHAISENVSITYNKGLLAVFVSHKKYKSL